MSETSKQYGHPDFYKLLDQMAELHSRKNHDYAGTSDPLKNLRACTRLELTPFIGVMVRLQDKWSRIEEFVKSKTLLVKDESVEDTLMDNAVYSLLAIILLREQVKAESVKDTAVTEKPINTHRSGWSRNCTKESCNDTAMFYCSVLKRSLCSNHYFSKPPQFKKGDRVRIDLRANASLWITEKCEETDYKGVYEAKDDEDNPPYSHVVCVDEKNIFFHDDEITLLEDK